MNIIYGIKTVFQSVHSKKITSILVFIMNDLRVTMGFIWHLFIKCLFAILLVNE
jgi:hypothetical protein